VRTPSSERLHTSALLSKRMKDRSFRESLPTNDMGEKHIVIADPEDTMEEVFARVDLVSMPASICVPIGGGGVFVIVVRDAEGSEPSADYQDCAPYTSGERPFNLE
jgi:hypothetical protein